LLPADILSGREHLRRKLDDMRGERDEYKQAAQALARALNVLTIENDTFRIQAGRLSQRPWPARPAPAPAEKPAFSAFGPILGLSAVGCPLSAVRCWPAC
jgi:hypothetical protein